MTFSEMKAAHALAQARDAIQEAQFACEAAGCDGQVVVHGLAEALEHVLEVLEAVSGSREAPCVL